MSMKSSDIIHVEHLEESPSRLQDEDVAEQYQTGQIPDTLPEALEFEGEPDEDYDLSSRTWAAVFSLAIANCCAVITNTTNTTITFQVQTVGGSSLASWIANGNFLLTIACGPIIGTLADRLGKKWFIVSCSLLGIIGSCVSGSAHSITQIIAGNMLTGIANAGCLLSISAVQETVKNKARPAAMGVNQTIGSCCAILGVFEAAGFVKHVNEGWRWAYFFNAFVYTASAILVGVTYHPPPPLLRRQNTFRNIIRQVDFLGNFLLAGSIASLITALTWGGSTYAWSDKKVIATLTAGCGGLVVFGAYETFAIKDGLFDHRLFQSRNFAILLGICIIDGFLLLGVNVLYPQQIGDFFSQDAVEIAAILSAFLFTAAFGCLPAGWLFSKTKKYRTYLVVALVWTTLFTGLMAMVTPNRLAMACVFSALFGAGLSVTTVIPISALALSVPSFLLGGAGLLAQSGRALGGVIGTTLFTAVYNNKFYPSIAQTVPPVAAANHLPEALIEAIMGILHSPLGVAGLATELHIEGEVLSELAAAVEQSQIYAWRYVWIAVAAVVACGALASCTLKSVKEKMNEHVESALERSTTRDSQMRFKH